MTFTLRPLGSSAPVASLAPTTPALLAPVSAVALAQFGRLFADGAKEGTSVDSTDTPPPGQFFSPQADEVAYLSTSDAGVTWVGHNASGDVIRDSTPAPLTHRRGVYLRTAPQFTTRGALAFQGSTLANAYVGQTVVTELSSGQWGRSVVVSDGTLVLVPGNASPSLVLDANTVAAAVIDTSLDASGNNLPALYTLRSTNSGRLALVQSMTASPVAITAAASTLGALITSRPAGSGLVAISDGRDSDSGARWRLVRW